MKSSALTRLMTVGLLLLLLSLTYIDVIGKNLEENNPSEDSFSKFTSTFVRPNGTHLEQSICDSVLVGENSNGSGSTAPSQQKNKNRHAACLGAVQWSKQSILGLGCKYVFLDVGSNIVASPTSPTVTMMTIPTTPDATSVPFPLNQIQDIAIITKSLPLHTPDKDGAIRTFTRPSVAVGLVMPLRVTF